MQADNARVHATVQMAPDRNGSLGNVSTRLDRAWLPADWRQEESGGVNCGNADRAAADDYLFVRRGEPLPGPGYAPLPMSGVHFNGLSAEIDYRLKAGYPRERL